MEMTNKLFEILDDVRSISDEISDEWIATCFEDNFSDFDSFAHAVRFSILQASDHPLLLTKLCSRLLLYAEKDENKSTEIWNEMAERNFDAKKLCLFAWYLIERGQQTDAALEDRKIGLLGARIYLTLCCFNGAQAFNIFNDHLFQRTLEELRLIHRLLFAKRLPESSKQKGKRGQAKTKKKPSDRNDSTTEETDREQITLEGKTELKRMLFDILDSTFIFLENVSLSSSQQSSQSFASLLLQLMQFDFSKQTSFLECNRLMDFQRLNSFSDRSFALIHRFLNDRHASSSIVYGRIVMPRLLYWTFDNVVLPMNAHPPRIMITYKDAMLNFMHLRIQKNQEEEMVTIQMLLENICFRCPDRNDYRAKVANCVIKALAYFPHKNVRDFATFLWQKGANPKVAVRSFIVEVALPLLEKYACVREGCDGLNDPSISNEAASDILIMELLLRSCNDTSSMVRARALSKIAVLLDNSFIRNKLLNIPISLVYGDDQQVDAVSSCFNIIIARCLDERVSVRRAAIAALEKLFLFPCLTVLEKTEALQIFKQRCRDPAIPVRKQAAQSLSHIALYVGAHNNMFDDAWLTSVLPMINDREQSVVQLISKLVLDTTIMPIIKDLPVPSPYRLLKAVEQEFYHRRFLLNSLQHQAKEGKLSELVVAVLLTKYNDPEMTSIVWMLLDFLSGIFKIDADPAVRFWYTLSENDENNLTGYVTHVIANCADRINETDRKQLIESISSKLIEFSVAENHITHFYYALARLYKFMGENANGAKQQLEFDRNLVNVSIRTLHSIIFHPIDAMDEIQFSQENNEKALQILVRIIISLGEAIQYSPILLVENPEAFHIMELIIAFDVTKQQQQRSTQNDDTLTNTVVQEGPGPSTSASTETGAGDFVWHERQQIGTTEGTSYDEPEDYAQVACDQMPTVFAQPGTEGSQKACAVPETGSQEHHESWPTIHGLDSTFLNHHAVNVEVLSSTVRASAVLTIGKMCLQDEKLTKKCVPVFSRELLVNSNHLVRCNIICVICDLCKRYTLLVDRHCATIASSLEDPSVVVRKQAVLLLTDLIKEQFIRWEGEIMYKFVLTILDKNKEVREYTKMCLIDILLVQFPNMFVGHFLKFLFHFNSVSCADFQRTASDSMNEDNVGKQEMKHFRSGVRLQKNARMELYKFMIKTCNDEKKFIIIRHITEEVFPAIAEGMLDVRNCRIRSLLEDCYEIMCFSEIKALEKRRVIKEDVHDDEPSLKIQETPKKVVKRASFRNGIVETILPYVLQLKHYLKKRLPELELGINRVLRELCKSDDQLAELMFEFRKREEDKRRMKAANNSTVMRIESNDQNSRNGQEDGEDNVMPNALMPQSDRTASEELTRTVQEQMEVDDDECNNNNYYNEEDNQDTFDLNDDLMSAIESTPRARKRLRREA